VALTLADFVTTYTPGHKSPGRARSLRRGAGVSAYVGPNGAGKSLTAAFDTLPTLAGIRWYCTNPDHFHTAEGITSGYRRVLSTMRFRDSDGSDHPLWDPLDDWRKIVRAEHVDLVLDEVGGAVASSTSDDIPAPVRAAIQEMRRKDVLVRHTAPGWMRAAKPLREVTQHVTLCLGFAPTAHNFGVTFPDAHDDCTVAGEHDHDSGRMWPARRLFYWRTYDANLFDEWTTAKREKLKPLVRQWFWRPGSEAEAVYDSHAYVEKLGQVTDSGTCIDCGGHRRRSACDCESPTTRRARVQQIRSAGA